MGASQSEEIRHQCAQHHDHKSMEDVRSCNEYFNNRGGESHKERVIDKLIDAHERGALSADDLGRAITGPRSLQEEDDINNMEYMISRTQSTRYNPHQSDRIPEKKKPKQNTNQGFLSNWFGLGDNYACPFHHKHKTMEEVNACTREHDERSKETHRIRIQEKLKKTEINGGNNGPIITEIE